MNWFNYWMMVWGRYLEATKKHPENSPIIPEIVNQPAPVVQPPAPPVNLTRLELLYDAAKACLGQNLTAGTGTPKELGCARSLNRVAAKAFGDEIGGGDSTALLWQALKASPDFEEISHPVKGVIIISPTGTSRVHYPHGHVGIVGIYGVMSNDSESGRWTQNYSQAGWEHFFGDIRGFPTYYFIPVG